MSRNILGLGLACSLAVFSGCAMCASPYDYAGPTVCDGLGFRERAGSILGGAVEPGYEGLVVNEPTLAPTPQEPAMEMELAEGSAPEFQPPATGRRPTRRIMR